MATISDERDINRISLKNVQNVGFSAEHSWLYIKTSESDYYFVTSNNNRIKKGKQPIEKALDSSEANDKLDQLISDASDGN
ncbi:hypothetical protein [Halobellus limi]|uniref:Uncharacterized protein n=1 Tax=Halobellus limi TaxID=699433 RepID=A0A1H5ZJN0_9EURY|nr:hypothetical protein [Halobellus limi]SEG36421.1 hypothetical protein SAMN04488133_2027 [Halobellus limi]